MNEEIQPKVLYKITAYDSDYIKETPDKVRTLNGNIYYYYDFKKHRYLTQFVHDEFDIYDEIKNLQQENHQLKEKLNIYENPEDLTLMFMYCEEKTKDKIKELKDRIEKALQIIDDSGIEIYGRNLDLLISTLKGEENDN